jgi:hypothetical protein
MKIVDFYIGKILFENQTLTVRETVEAALKAGVSLRGANLFGANLKGTNLKGANLVCANLGSADLWDANLSGADLRYAILEGAILKDAYLWGANLQNAYLWGANLLGANLDKTCLDPKAKLPRLLIEDIKAAGFKVKGKLVYGWRTQRSQHCGSQEYVPGRCHKAPAFSVDTNTPCHPGIYLASKDWLEKEYDKDIKLVQCFCRKDELVCAENKWRCKRLWIVKA